MSKNGHLGDPAFEPSDEELAELCRNAFADVRASHERAMIHLRARIEQARKEALARLDQA